MPCICRPERVVRGMSSGLGVTGSVGATAAVAVGAAGGGGDRGPSMQASDDLVTLCHVCC